MYKICFYVPTSHVDQVKEAMFVTGAGKIGNYHGCAWQTLGEGQFMPLPGSHAYLGDIGQVEKISEFKVEIVCEDAHLDAAIAALKQAHPYEVPAYQVWKLENI